MIAVAVVVTLAFLVETLTGFGGTVLSLAIGCHFLPLSDLVPALLCLSLVQSSIIVSRQPGAVRRDVLAREILPFAGVGFVLGSLAIGGTEAQLRLVLGVLIALVAGLEVLRQWKPQKPNAVLSSAAVTLAGGFYALLGAGGPLVVFAIARRLDDKRAFRATLAATWLVLGLVLLASLLWRGQLEARHLELALYLSPGLALGYVLGELLHRRVSAEAFRRVVTGLLVVAAVAVFV